MVHLSRLLLLLTATSAVHGLSYSPPDTDADSPDPSDQNDDEASGSSPVQAQPAGPPQPATYQTPSTDPRRSSISAANHAASTDAAARIGAQSQLGISSGQPNASLVDPCGPPDNPAPGAPGSFNTCHQNVSTEDATSSGAALDGFGAYSVRCLNDGTGYVLDQKTCSDSAITICYQISGMYGTKYQTPNQWIWSTENGNCTFGYWLPAGGAPPPSYERCTTGIMGVMNEACQGPKFNAASVNLLQLPWSNSSGNGTGQAVDAGYPSYIMVAQQSYDGVNSEDDT